MTDPYATIRDDYLERAWSRGRSELERALPATPEAGGLRFRAFGEDCLLEPGRITLGSTEAGGPEALLIAMYACQASEAPIHVHPLKAFKDLPGSMPYHGAFTANSERILIPHVPAIQRLKETIVQTFSGRENDDASSGDFSFTLLPLPRVALYYVFHLPDDEFPASVTALFGASSVHMMPLDGLADVAEYTAKRIRSLCREA